MVQISDIFAHKVAKSKYFSNTYTILISDEFSFQRSIINPKQAGLFADWYGRGVGGGQIPCEGPVSMERVLKT